MPEIRGALVVRDDPETEISGTLDCVPGRAGITDAFITEVGAFELEWAGETEMFWDEQKTLTTNGGRRIFLDDDGNQYTSDQLAIRVGDELHPVPCEPCKPVGFGEPPTLDRALAMLLIEALGVAEGYRQAAEEDQDSGVEDGLYVADADLDREIAEHKVLFARALAAVSALDWRSTPVPGSPPELLSLLRDALAPGNTTAAMLNEMRGLLAEIDTGVIETPIAPEVLDPSR